MSVFALGLNHTTAPVDLRGRFALNAEQLTPALLGFREQISHAHEVAIVSTCNRTELYVGADPGLVNPAIDWLAGVGRVGSHALREHSYVLEGGACARHAFRVASGLDSMVLGEPQILGQMKQAVREADSAGTLGTTLHQMFQRSFAVAKEVRTVTEIGLHSISMAAAAVRLAGQLFEDLSKTRVLFVGAGEMIELVATHFAARAPQGIAVANRTLERGQQLARTLNAQAMRLSDLPTRLAEFDIIISCTASPVPIIGLGAVESALKARRRRPMFMVDLAVPRDIEPEVGRIGDVYLYTVDDLSALVQTAGEKRLAAVAQAESIIESGVQSFVHWLDQRQSVPLIRALHQQADTWRQAELMRAQKLLAKGEPIDAVLESLSRGLMQKALHGPLTQLHATAGDERDALADNIARMFLRQNPNRGSDSKS